MPTFGSKPFRSANAAANTLSDKIATNYRKHLGNHPFLLFGLPFIGIIVASSFLLTPATALRYERHDRKNQSLSYDEAVQMGLKRGTTGDGPVNYNPRRRLITKGGTTERDEYYVWIFWLFDPSIHADCALRN